jgi:carbonyl reductase 1
VERLRNDAQLRRAKALVSEGGRAEIRFHRLDIGESESVRDFAGFLGREHPDGVDFGEMVRILAVDLEVNSLI